MMAIARIIAIGLCAPLPVEPQTTLTPVIASMVSGASFQAGPIAPGEVVTFFGIGLGSAAPVSFKPDGTGHISRTLGSTRVLFNENAAPLLYASSTRATAIAPVDLVPPPSQPPVTVADTTPAKPESFYVVKPGDSLTKIAVEQLGSPAGVPALLDLNKETLKGTDKIRPNMKLRLPAKPLAAAM